MKEPFQFAVGWVVFWHLLSKFPNSTLVNISLHLPKPLLLKWSLSPLLNSSSFSNHSSLSLGVKQGLSLLQLTLVHDGMLTETNVWCHNLRLLIQTIGSSPESYLSTQSKHLHSFIGPHSIRGWESFNICLYVGFRWTSTMNVPVHLMGLCDRHCWLQ